MQNLIYIILLTVFCIHTNNLESTSKKENVGLGIGNKTVSFIHFLIFSVLTSLAFEACLVTIKLL